MTPTAENDIRTGIQRVVCSIVRALIEMDLPEYRIEPVYLSDKGGGWHYRYTRQWASQIMGRSSERAVNEPIDRAPSDFLLIVDFMSGGLYHVMLSGIYDDLRRDGVEIKTVTYDLLPILFPSYFPAENEVELNHKLWLEAVFKLDGTVCISKSVADELTVWAKKNTDADLSSFSIDWFHLGADIGSCVPTKGCPDDYLTTVGSIEQDISFLMVGTIEPRKGYAQSLAAFQLIWDKGVDVNLVFVGKQGWNMNEFFDKIKSSTEYNRKLFWLEGISDEYLEKIYEASSCLIAASEAEGLGLPLIGAAQYKLPIVARDIPVFREVATEYAFYFKDSQNPQDIAGAVTNWLELNTKSKAPRSDDMPWLTW